MPVITFLGADVPLTKTIKADGSKDAYPLVKNFTSYNETCNTIKDLHTAIMFHADQGHCLLKGNIARPLVNEPRAGTTRTDENTQWVCLDFDRHACASIDDVLTTFGLGDISYVIQYSSSHGLPENEGTVSAHIFMMLDKAVPAPLLKSWLMSLNLTHLKEDLRLSRSKTIISWPLDITTCQNDKLLYIAPPTFKGIKDPLKTRIALIEKKTGSIATKFIGERNINSLKTEERKELNTMRELEGLPKRTAKTTWVGTIEVQNKPDTCTVTGRREQGDYVRLNLNGGDSWAYWHSKDNFEIIHDFKSDTYYRTKELVPGYYQELIDERAALNSTPSEDGDLILAFRDMKTAEYYNGLYNVNTSELQLYRAKNETQLDHWMRSHGRMLGDFIPVWDIQYEPRENWTIDQDRHLINTFRPSPYMSREPNEKLTPKDFPSIYGIIRHLLGENGKDTTLSDAFLNWFAVIFQRKAKPLTAWVIHGCEGCLAPETEINFRRGKRTQGRPLTIKEAYEKWNGIYKLGRGGKAWNLSLKTYAQSVKDDFTIGYHEIYRIVESGVKMLYRVVTNDGGIIRVTAEHPFMRPDGSMTKLCDLKVGDIVLKKGEKNSHIRQPKGRNKNRITIHSIPHHPYAWQHIINGKNYKRSHRARLVWEADMNGLTLDEFVNILRNDPDRATKLHYLSNDLIVHHIDEDCSNDDLSNLTTVDKFNHDRHHAEHTGLGTILTREAKIISITEDREEMTYDMTMKAPYHNYVANDFCVSNTGKGFFYNKIAAPLLSQRNTISITVSSIEEQFNGWMEGKLFVLIDEVDVDDFREKGKVAAKLRNAITEPTIPLRRMRQATIDAPNYASFLFSSNRPQPVYIPPTDRRYNVGNYQPFKLDRPDDDIVANELEKFAEWLLAHKADVALANQIQQTEARDLIQKLGVSSVAETCTAMKEGDFDKLWLSMLDDELINRAPVQTPHTVNAQNYNTLMKHIAEVALKSPKTTLSRDEMAIILQYNVGNIRPEPNRITSLLRHNGVDTKQIRHNGKKTYGINVEWKMSDEIRAEVVALLNPKTKLRKIK